MSQKKILDLASVITEEHDAIGEPAAEIIRLAAIARTRGLISNQQWDMLKENGYLLAKDIDLGDLAQANIQYHCKVVEGDLRGQQLTPNEYAAMMYDGTIDMNDVEPEVKIYYKGTGLIARAFGPQETLKDDDIVAFRLFYGELWKLYVKPYLDLEVDPEDFEDDDSDESESSEELGTSEESEGSEEIENADETERADAGESDEVPPDEEGTGEETADEEPPMTEEEELQAAIAEWDQAGHTSLVYEVPVLNLWEESFDPILLKQAKFDGVCISLGLEEGTPEFFLGWDLSALANYSKDEILAVAKAIRNVLGYSARAIDQYAKDCVAKLETAEEQSETDDQATAESADTAPNTGDENTSQDGTDPVRQEQLGLGSKIAARMQKYPITQWKKRLEEIMTDDEKAALTSSDLNIDTLFVGIAHDMSVAQIVSLFVTHGMDIPAELTVQLDKTNESIMQQIQAEEAAVTSNT